MPREIWTIFSAGRRNGRSRNRQEVQIHFRFKIAIGRKEPNPTPTLRERNELAQKCDNNIDSRFNFYGRLRPLVLTFVASSSQQTMQQQQQQSPFPNVVILAGYTHVSTPRFPPLHFEPLFVPPLLLHLDDQNSDRYVRYTRSSPIHFPLSTSLYLMMMTSMSVCLSRMQKCEKVFAYKGSSSSGAQITHEQTKDPLTSIRRRRNDVG